jgi:hypothetical protein
MCPLESLNGLLFIQIQALPQKMQHKWEEIIDIVCKNGKKTIEGPLPTKSPIELKDNSIIG